jgi:hypothetical protein
MTHPVTAAAAQGQPAPTAHVEIASDGPGQIYVGESRALAATRQAEAEAEAAEPEAGS